MKSFAPLCSLRKPLPNAVDNTTPTVNLEVDTATGELVNYPGIGQCAGEEVLLRDVIHVFYETVLFRWPFLQ